MKLIKLVQIKMLFTILIITTFTSCNEHKNHDTIPLKRLKLIDSINIKYLFNIRDLLVKDNLIIFSNNRSDSIIVIYDLLKNEIIKSFGKRGKGNNEFIFPNLAFNDPENPYFFINDFGRKKITRVNIRNLSDITNYTYSFNTIPLTLIALNDSIYVFDTFNPKQGKIIETGITGDIEKVVYDFPDLYKKFNESSFYKGFMTYNYKKNLIAYAYMRLDRLDIISLSGTLIKKTDKTIYKRINKKDLMENEIFCGGIFSDDKFIYIEKTKAKEKELVRFPEHIPGTIECYSWDGYLRKRIYSDRYFRYFFINEKKHLLYNFDDQKENYQLKIYQIL